mgnify:CR=1 FL=1
MNRTEYKNNFYKEHYERISLAVPARHFSAIKKDESIALFAAVFNDT